MKSVHNKQSISRDGFILKTSGQWATIAIHGLDQARRWCQPHRIRSQAYCKDKIEYYIIPMYYKFTDAFPMTVTGKVKKMQMREMSVRELGPKV